MPKHVELENKLNCLLWALFGLTLASGFLSKWIPWIGYVGIAVAAVSLIWVLAIFWWRLTHLTDEKRVYRRPTDGDYWRLFVVLWLGYGKIATLSPSAFLFMSLLATPLLFLLATIGVTDWILEKSISTRAIGCFAFTYFLFVWQKNALVEHYGVPIIGHFLEKPNFEAQYYVEVEGEGSGPEYTLLADIRVESYSETEDAGYEDRFGQSVTHTFKVKDIWIKRLRFPNGGWVDIDYQDEPVTMNDGGYVTDVRGRGWYVRMTDRKTN